MSKKKYTYPYRIKETLPNGKVLDIKAKTKRELAEKYKDRKEKALHNFTPAADYTVEKWALECIDTKKPNQAPDTKRKYKSRVKHCILEEIGTKKLTNVTREDCQHVLNLQRGKSKTQINEVHQALSFIFKQAKLANLIIENPTENLERPKGTHKTRRPLSPEERSMVLEVGKEDRRYYLYLLMLLCGCRPSEAAECMGKDIIIKDKKNFLHIRGTKSSFADRVVPIPHELYSVISNTPQNEYIAQSRNGNKLLESARRRVWSSFKREINIRMGCKVYNNALVPPYPLASDFVPYNLRHEYCKELWRRQVDIRDAQRLMGHSSIQLTNDIYTNLDQGEVADRVHDLLL